MGGKRGLREAAAAFGLTRAAVVPGGGPADELLGEGAELSELPTGELRELFVGGAPDHDLRVFEISRVEPSAFEGGDVLSWVGGLAKLDVSGSALVIRTFPRIPKVLRPAALLLRLFAGAGFGQSSHAPRSKLGDPELDERLEIQARSETRSALLGDDAARSWLLGLREGWTIVIRDGWILVVRRGDLDPKTLAEVLATLERARTLARPSP